MKIECKRCINLSFSYSLFSLSLSMSASSPARLKDILHNTRDSQYWLVNRCIYTSVQQIYWMIYEPVWLVKHLCEMGCPETWWLSLCPPLASCLSLPAGHIFFFAGLVALIWPWMQLRLGVRHRLAGYLSNAERKESELNPSLRVRVIKSSLSAPIPKDCKWVLWPLMNWRPVWPSSS